MKREEGREIDTWTEMRRVMRNRYVPTSHIITKPSSSPSAPNLLFFIPIPTFSISSNFSLFHLLLLNHHVATWFESPPRPWKSRRRLRLRVSTSAPSNNYTNLRWLLSRCSTKEGRLVDRGFRWRRRRENIQHQIVSEGDSVHVTLPEPRWGPA